MKDKRMRAAIIWGAVLLLCFCGIIVLFDEDKPGKEITGHDVALTFEGPIVAFTQHADGTTVIVRDLTSGKLGYAFFKKEEMDKWDEEVKEAVQNEQYNAMIGIFLEYSSELIEEERYEYYGYPLANAWIYVGDEISQDYVGKIVTYFENETGKVAVIHDREKDELVYVQFSAMSYMDEEMNNLIKNETCGVEVVVSCKYNEYADYEGYPVVNAKIYER